MLKTRIIPVVLYRGDAAIKGKRFRSWRSVGSVQNVVQVHSAREVDELFLIDIGATPEGRGPDFERIKRISADAYMPLTVGGGVSTLRHFEEALRSGADKVLINTAAVRTPDLIEGAAKRFGSQAVVVGLDFLEDGVTDGSPLGRRQAIACGLDPLVGTDCVEFAKRCADLGAGELLLTSISRDGLMCGYDLLLLREVAAAVQIPVVANGGAGNVGHFAEALRVGVHAVAAGSIWHWRDITPAKVAQHLFDGGFAVRRDFAANMQIES